MHANGREFVASYMFNHKHATAKSNVQASLESYWAIIGQKSGVAVLVYTNYSEY